MTVSIKKHLAITFRGVLLLDDVNPSLKHGPNLKDGELRG